MAKNLRNFIDDEIFPKIETNKQEISSTNEFLERVDKLCYEH